MISASLAHTLEEPMTPEPHRATDEVLRRVQGEFLEMPGLRLTEPQARRLWGLDAASCDALLGALVDAKFLFRTRDGAFMRVEHAAPVKALDPATPMAASGLRHDVSSSEECPPVGWTQVLPLSRQPAGRTTFRLPRAADLRVAARGQPSRRTSVRRISRSPDADRLALQSATRCVDP